MPTTIPADHPPVAVADSATVAAGGTVLIDVLANDYDPDPGETAFLGIVNVTALMENGQPVPGTLTQAPLPDGRVGLLFTANDPYFDTGSHTLTFTYQVVDQWDDPEDPTYWAYTRGGPITVTIHVTGNAVQGETICGTNHPQVLTPDNPNHDPRIHYGLKGNDVLFGGNSGDTIDGGLGADTVSGGNGTDKVSGGAGSDVVNGDNGDDTLDGGAGGDKIFGGNGVDSINGGTGNDTITGGNSADRFYFGADTGHDRITDFDVKNEKIYLDHNFVGSYGGVLDQAHDDGHGNVVITSVDGLSSITLEHVTESQLRESDFVFV